jgi:hypothetical protein
VKIITANIGHKDGVSTWRRNVAVRLLCGRAPDVLMLQELRGSRILVPSGYAMRRGHDLAILWRKSHKFAGWGEELVHAGREGQWVERWLMWVELEELGSFVNIHLNSKIETAGRPRDGVNRDRLNGALLNLRRARILVARLRRSPAYVGGDTNVAAGPDNRVLYPGFPAAELRRVGLHDLGPRDKGTLGSRAVDRVLGPEGTRADWRVVNLGPAFDHDAVEVTTLT